MRKIRPGDEIEVRLIIQMNNMYVGIDNNIYELYEDKAEFILVNGYTMIEIDTEDGIKTMEEFINDSLYTHIEPIVTDARKTITDVEISIEENYTLIYRESHVHAPVTMNNDIPKDSIGFNELLRGYACPQLYKTLHSLKLKSLLVFNAELLSIIVSEDSCLPDQYKVGLRELITLLGMNIEYKNNTYIPMDRLLRHLNAREGSIDKLRVMVTDVIKEDDVLLLVTADSSIDYLFLVKDGEEYINYDYVSQALKILKG